LLGGAAVRGALAVDRAGVLGDFRLHQVLRQDPHALPQEVDVLRLIRLVNQFLQRHRGLGHREPPRSGSFRVEDVAVISLLPVTAAARDRAARVLRSYSRCLDPKTKVGPSE
jgi:hypothetical protein